MKLLEKKNVRILNTANDWREAIRLSVEPLEEQGYVEARYKEEIIANIESLGPYIVIAPYVALPHARPEQGVIKSQISITLFKEAVQFDHKEAPVKLFIVLAAADQDGHLDALVKISEVLQSSNSIETIISAEDTETLYQYFAA
ncbi:MAG: PTS sugar transporter subunit IIA [Hungatella sp.]|jgi:PTS system ascorbate-specific IIA component|nr:PTS sugar transporter subunit IIA [Hungatella sp.]